MINQSSHLSLAHGKFHLMRSNAGHDLKTYMNADIKWVKPRVWSGFPAWEQAGWYRSEKRQSRSIATCLPQANPARDSSDPSHQCSQGQRLDSHWKSFPENRRSSDQSGLRRSHWLGDYRERFAGQVPSKAGVREGGAAAAGGCRDSRGKLPSLCKALQ